ncbi:MAG: thioredoxin domain-containing protein, partial [Methylococcales bacterium]
IKGLAIAGRAFGRPDWIERAYRAFDFLRDRLWVNGRLLATHKDGRSHLNAYLDDYACLIDAAIELAQSEWRSSAIEWAEQLADILIDQFEDKAFGGFFFTSNDHEKLIHRPKPMMDESTPAGNAVAACALARLGHILGKIEYLEAASRVFEACAASLARYPSAHAALLIALEDFYQAPRTVVLRGSCASDWKEILGAEYQPDLILLDIRADLEDLPGVLRERKAFDRSVAYVCTAAACLPACHSLESLLESLQTESG